MLTIRVKNTQANGGSRHYLPDNINFLRHLIATTIFNGDRGLPQIQLFVASVCELLYRLYFINIT